MSMQLDFILKIEVHQRPRFMLQVLAECPFTHLPIWLCECNPVSESTVAKDCIIEFPD